jgi:hypothetical protein
MFIELRLRTESAQFQKYKIKSAIENLGRQGYKNRVPRCLRLIVRCSHHVSLTLRENHEEEQTRANTSTSH